MSLLKTKLSQNILSAAYKDLAIRARVDVDFILLTAASACICTFGFRMDSVSVIIGAMVIAPLLYPMIFAGAGIFRRDLRSLGTGLLSFLIGLIVTILLAALINTILPTTHGSEIQSRLTATPLDYFFVALLSGFAGTVAFFWPKIIEAIAGIAVAVALVPPLALVGIGLAEFDPNLVLLSAIIVLFNVIGILIGSFGASAFLFVIAKVRK